MSEVVGFEKWKKDNSRAVSRVEKVRARPKDLAPAGGEMKQSSNSTEARRRVAEQNAKRIMSNPNISNSAVWNFAGVAAGKFKHYFETRELEYLEDILLNPAKYQILDEHISRNDIQEIFQSDPIYFRLAAEAYLKKLKEREDAEKIEKFQSV